MSRILNLTLLTFIFCSILFGQGGNGNGDSRETGKGNSSEVNKPKSDSETLITYLPGKWETYLADDDKIAVLFPKLPLILDDTSNNCFGEYKVNFVTYSDGKVFVLQRVKSITPNKYCEYKKEFSAENFPARLKELGLKIDAKPITKKSDKFNIYKTVVKGEILWLYDDGKNTGWYELRVVNSNETDSISTEFLKSLKVAKKQKGISIGQGASSIIGDKVIKNELKASKTSENSSSEVKTSPLKIVFNPRANYTDEARETNTMGAVRLKVTLLANGSIGSITVVSGLPYGLTEQAIAAARKIVFIPPHFGSKKNTVSKIFEYRFTLY